MGGLFKTSPDIKKVNEMVVKVSCPECKTTMEYDGEIKKGRFVTCSNPECKFPSGKRRRIKVIPNVIPSDTGDTSDTNKKTSEVHKESKQEQSDTNVIPEKTMVIPGDTKIKPKKIEKITRRSDNIMKSDTVIPSDTCKSVSRIIEILDEALDIKTGGFWSFHQTMSTRRAFPKEVMSKFQKICLELRKELDKIEKID